MLGKSMLAQAEMLVVIVIEETITLCTKVTAEKIPVKWYDYL